MKKIFKIGSFIAGCTLVTCTISAAYLGVLDIIYWFDLHSENEDSIFKVADNYIYHIKLKRMLIKQQFNNR